MFQLILRNIETEGGVTISRTGGRHNTLWPEVEMKSFSLLTNEGLVVEVDRGGPALGQFGHMRHPLDSHP